jgi:uncharacterized membrane protein YhaH (DUF805 family)
MGMGIFHLFFGFSGRINRGKYWLTLAIWILIWFVGIVAFVVGDLAIFDRNLKDGSLPSPEDSDAFWMVRDYGALSVIILVCLIVSWVSALAIGVKRLHDRDRSGWWIVLFYFGPALLQAAQNSAESGTLASILLGLGAFAVSIWALVEFGFLRGTRGPNRFGADPLAREVALAA